MVCLPALDIKSITGILNGTNIFFWCSANYSLACRFASLMNYNYVSKSSPSYSSGADASSLSSIGHHLSGKEHVIDSLKKIGFDMKTIGDTQATIEEAQSLLYSLEQHEIASSLRQCLDLGKLTGGIAIHAHALNHELYSIILNDFSPRNCMCALDHGMEYHCTTV